MTVTTSVPAPRSLFIGREREFADLCAVIDGAFERRGGLALVAGDPGAGKTRLVQEVARYASARGMRVGWARCSAEGSHLSFWPFTQASRQIYADMDSEEVAAEAERFRPFAHAIGSLDTLRRGVELTHAPLSDSERLRFFDDMAAMTRRSEVPCLLVFDDVHWADVPSMRVLEYIAPFLADSPVGYIATFRETEARGGDLGRAIAALPKYGPLMRLSGLDQPSVDVLVRDGLGPDVARSLVETVYSVTEGNPYFVDEVVRLLRSNAPVGESADVRIPETVFETIRLRLERIDPVSRSILDRAAVIGRSFEVALLERVIDADHDRLLLALEDAMSRGVIEQRPVSAAAFRFAHPLMQQTLYNDIPASERAQLHRDAGEALESLAGDAAVHRLPELANQFIHAVPAAPASKAIDYARMAGRQALAAMGYEDAVWYFERALELVDRAPTVDAVERCRLLLAIGEAEAAAGRHQKAASTYARCADLAGDLGAHEEHLRAAIGFTYAAHDGPLHHRFSEAIDRLTGAMEEAHDVDPALKSFALSGLSRALHYRSKPEETIALAREAVELAEQQENGQLLAVALHALLSSMWVPEHTTERLDVGARLISTALAADALDDAFQGAIRHCTDLIEVGRLEEARHLFESVERSDERWTRNPNADWWLATCRAREALILGELGRARGVCDELADLSPRFGWAEGARRWAGLVLAWETGDASDLDARLADLFSNTGIGSAYRRVLRVFVDAEAGRTDGARAELSRIGAVGFSDLPRNSTILWTVPALASVAARVGDAEAAGELYQALEPFGGRIVNFGMMCLHTTSHWLGVLAATMERHDDADRHFREAIEMCTRLGAQTWLARTRVAHARALASRGDTQRAVSEATLASAVVSDLGLDGLRLEIDQLLGGGSVVPSPPAPAPIDAVAATFRRDGDYWTVAWKGSVVRVRDAKGMRFLRDLLSAPGREYFALDLQMAHAGRVGASAKPSAKPLAKPFEGMSLESDAGELLDAEAKQAYRRRVEDLRAEVDEATSWGDTERASRAQDEIDAIANELGRAVGLGGRDRRAADPAERARLNVTRAIRRAIESISSHSGDLGRHLDVSIRTGIFCAYEPYAPVDWEL